MVGYDTDSWKMRKLSRSVRHNHYCQKLAWLTWLHVSVRMRITMKVYLGAPLLGLQLLRRGGLGGYVVLDLGVRHGVGGVELDGDEGSLLLTCAAGLFVRWRVLPTVFRPSHWTECKPLLSPIGRNF